MVTVVVLVVLAIGVYAPSTVRAPTNISTSTTSTTCTTSTSASTTTSTSTSKTSSGTSNITVGSFSYSPTSPVVVTWVQAVTNVNSNGQRIVTFEVGFENVGNSTIYVVSGCGSGLSSSITGDSSVLGKVTGGPLCLCAEFILALDQGGNHSYVNPGCWSGYSYDLLGSGTVDVSFTLNWSTKSNGFQGGNSTLISASFPFD